MTWYRANAAMLEQTVAEVHAVQPLLTLVDRGDVVVFAGTYEIKNGAAVLDRFEIEVTPCGDNPRGLPRVKETAGRIPREMDLHHVISDDGLLCVALPDWFWYHYPKGLTLPEYLGGPLRAHLVGQALVLAGDKWPQGEWPHGKEGRMQFYEEQLGTRDPVKLFQMLLAAAGRGKIRGDQRCPCGSKRRVLVCHRRLLDIQARIPRGHLVDAAASFNDKRKQKRCGAA